MDRLVYPTRRAGIYVRTKQNKVSTLVTLINLPTMEKGRTHENVRVMFPRQLLDHYIREGRSEMGALYPLLDPSDFAIVGDPNSDGDLVLSLSKNTDGLQLNLDLSDTAAFEPAWLPSFRPHTNKTTSLRTRNQITTLEVTSERSNMFGEIRVFPGGSPDPLLVLGCVKEGSISFTHTQKTSVFTTVQQTFEHIVSSPRYMGVYSGMEENILVSRMVALSSTMEEWAEYRHETFVTDDAIVTAASQLTSRRETVTLETETLMLCM